MQVLKRFKSDQGGATAVIFGLAFLPLMGVVGGTVDYSRAALEQTKLQRAVDATVLALAREPRTATQKELESKASQVLAATYVTPKGVALEPIKVERQGETVTLSRSAKVPNAFMQIFGIPETPVGAKAAAAWGTQRIELALVLDNTGSMADGIGGGRRKIDELSAASKKLLADLRAIATGPDTVKVSIVPFDTEVRLDPNTNRNKSWFRWADPVNDPKNWTGHVFERHGRFALSDDAPRAGNEDTLFPAPVVSEYKTVKVLKNLHTSGGTLATVRPLTSLQRWSDYDGLVKTIEGMTPRGYTNVALGAVWGLSTLSRSEPFTEGAAATDKNVRRYMVLLTDGKNNFHHVDGELRNDEAQVDRNTRAACRTVKQAGIELFTIRLVEGDENLLRNCASSASHYFNVQSSAELKSAFDGIVDAISGTRLTH